MSIRGETLPGPLGEETTSDEQHYSDDTHEVRESILRRSERTPKPSIKVQENCETQFWELVNNLNQSIEKIDKHLQTECSVSVKMSMEREVLKASEDLDKAYEQLRYVFPDSVPSAARTASDRCHGGLMSLLDGIRVVDRNPLDILDKMSIKTSSTTSSKRALLAAKAAALQVELEARQIESQQRLDLARLEAREKARQAEVEIEFERRRGEIEDKKLEMELKKTETEMKALEQGSSINIKPAVINKSSKDFTTQKHEVIYTPAAETAIQDLTKSFSESLNLSRLPAPEPFVFDGEPLNYPAWKAAFSALIDHQGISPREKIHYLRKYLSGEARESVEGLFYFDSKEAYLASLKMLEERYGNPFLVAEGFRNKIENWPRIQANDSKALRKFTDFLRQCLVAIAHIPSLEILNDCRENRKMLTKLPDWMVRTWSRIVTEETAKGSFPSFEKFVTFLTKEADIACNPVVTVENLRQSRSPEKPRTLKRAPAANTLATKNQTQETRTETSRLEIRATPRETQRQIPHQAVKHVTKPQTVCVFCKRSNHSMNSCRDFMKKTALERSEFIMANGLCFSCLSHGHLSRDCKAKHSCGKCGKMHPICLCGDFETLHPKKQTIEQAAGTSISCRAKTTVINQSPTSSMIVPVLVSSTDNPSEEILVYALLDTQSDTSFILEETLDKLQTATTPTVLQLTTMTNTSNIDSTRAEGLMVRSICSPNKLLLPTVYSRGNIPANLEHISTKEVTQKWPHLDCLASKIPDKQDCEVGLLIGYDCPQALAPIEVVRGDGNQPFGVLTELGWSIVGKTHCSEESEHLSHRVLTKSIQEDLQILQGNFVRSEVGFVCQAKVRDVSTPEILSILESDFPERKDSDTCVSQEDIKFIKTMMDGICQDSEGFYQMPLPFNSDSPVLPESLRMAKKRLRHLKRKLESNDKYLADYKQFMNNIIERGEAEEVPLEEISDEKSWYIPHHGIYHPRKPSKIRVVFDCSAQSSGSSLNDVLLQGPDLLNSLVGVLCRFRERPFAIVGDIERMFHQFRVDPKDRNYLRFLWWKDGLSGREPTAYRMKVHLFGAKSSPGCANYGLKKLAADHKNSLSKAADFVTTNFYVDDGLGSFDTENEATSLVGDLRHLCAKGNLHLHKFMSNSPAVMKSIPETEHADEMRSDLFDEAPLGRVLGVEWGVDADQFQFRLTVPVKPMTRRGVLSTVASIYDPLGFLGPFVLLGKAILQEACRSQSDWDDELCEELRPRWERWLKELPLLTEFKVMRCLIPKDFGNVTTHELHHFSDASFSGYGQCSYLRVVNATGRVHCSLVIGKARVTPLRVMTIPRLELTAATVAVKISSLLRSETNYSQVKEHFWTDSKIVLGYIHNDAKRFQVFVANRIQKIREQSDPHQWRYVCSAENPADHASRGMYARELIDSNWLTGPEFLWKAELPEPEGIETEISPDDPERKRILVHTVKTEHTKTVLERLEYFSDWRRAVTAITVLLNWIYKKTMKKPEDIRHEAELKMIQMIQAKEFSEEIAAIKQQRALHRGSRLIRLDPFIDSEG